MITEIKELRVKIDGLAQLTTSIVFDKDNIKKINTNLLPENISVEKWTEYVNLLGWEFTNKNTYSPQVRKATESLYLAKAWLGKMLEELGTESPYKAGYKTKKDIEPTADVAENKVLNKEGAISVANYMLLPNWDNGNMSHIQKVDLIREEIKRLTSELVNLNAGTMPTWKLSVARTNTYNYLCEARFQLGFELQRIKENG